MRRNTTFIIAAVLAAVGIALGAFGAHGLKDVVEPAMLANWETGVRYHMYAALAMLAISARPEQRRAPWFLLGGALVFGGSLYLMALTGARWLGAVTPFGGVLLIVGLLIAAFDVSRAARPAADVPEREYADR
ncbi:DUF423 domain-containing protein [Granulicoccus sp. GXG6511]|uniref:DUF423 domain-containing protein n=1 Tax=Granulicoccus sp. GXG6511 TaxID=3381351 RepID=UPI003D7D023D